MTRNGRNQPGRPRIELQEGAASPEEAAAIAAAIEQFLRDTAPAPAPEPRMNPWLRAGLLDATGRSKSASWAAWGSPPDRPR